MVLTCFLFELTMRQVAKGWRFVKDKWNIFDFVVRRRAVSLSLSLPPLPPPSLSLSLALSLSLSISRSLFLPPSLINQLSASPLSSAVFNGARQLRRR